MTNIEKLELINKRNEKIALYMCDTIEGRYFLFKYLKSKYKTGWYEIANMSFHESWDWLIPVYAKIYKDGFISKSGMALMLKHVPQLQESISKNDINSAYESIIELIEYLNKSK